MGLLALVLVALFAVAMSFLIPPLLLRSMSSFGKRPQLGTACKPKCRLLASVILPFNVLYLNRTRS